MLAPSDLTLLAGRFHREFGYSPDRLFFAPGRVNLIGEHIDYLGGTVLPAAIDRGIVALASPRNDQQIRLRSVEQATGADLQLDSLPDNIAGLPATWLGYPVGMFRLYRHRLQRGADMLFASDLPAGSGLSSSAALEVLTGYAIRALQADSADEASFSEEDRIGLAVDARSVENEYIGVHCGIMDQFAVSLGRRHHALHLNTRTLAYRTIPFTSDQHVLVVLNSNRPRKLSESKYNERRAQCDRALGLIRRLRPDTHDLATVALDDLTMLDNEPLLLRRARHAITENLRVEKAVQCLNEKDLKAFGQLLDASHRSLQDDFEVSCYELDVLCEESRAHPSCIGARMTGAGFGGCAIALLQTTDEDVIADFIQTVGQNYRDRTDCKGDLFTVQMVDGVCEQELV